MQARCPHCGVTTEAQAAPGEDITCSACGRSFRTQLFDAGPPPANNSPPRRRKSKALLFGLMALAIGVVLLTAMSVPAVLSARHAAKRMLVSNSLKSLVLALHNYHERYGEFPPAYVADESGKPMHSWRVLLLPDLQEEELYQQYDFSQPWDAPQNLEVAKKIPDIYKNPFQLKSGKTCYVVVTGEETNFPGAESSRLPSIFAGSRGPLAQVLLIEASAEEFNWTEPVDLKLEELDLKINRGGAKQLNSRIGGGIMVGYVDGRVATIAESTSGESLRELMVRPRIPSLSTEP
jgi:hypothetical protein